MAPHLRTAIFRLQRPLRDRERLISAILPHAVIPAASTLRDAHPTVTVLIPCEETHQITLATSKTLPDRLRKGLVAWRPRFSLGLD